MATTKARSLGSYLKDKHLLFSRSVLSDFANTYRAFARPLSELFLCFRLIESSQQPFERERERLFNAYFPNEETGSERS